jgi:hypothetical protein
VDTFPIRTCGDRPGMAATGVAEPSPREAKAKFAPWRARGWRECLWLRDRSPPRRVWNAASTKSLGRSTSDRSGGRSGHGCSAVRQAAPTSANLPASSSSARRGMSAESYSKVVSPSRRPIQIELERKANAQGPRVLLAPYDRGPHDDPNRA